MPSFIKVLLNSRAFEFGVRVVLTFPFWGSGLDKLINFGGGVAEMRQFGLEPAVAFNSAVLTAQLLGSALIIANRATWLGAGALAVFTALTIPLVHRFWAMDGAASLHAFHTAAEHVGTIGALALVSILAARPRARGEPTRIEMPTIVMAR